MFLADPLDVPGEAGDCIAGQLGVDVSCLAGYAVRERTRLEHQWEIAREFGYRDFADAERELVGWVDDVAWTTGLGPNAIFADALQILAPGGTATQLVDGHARW